MKDAQTPVVSTGTSLAVIGPYLAHALEVADAEHPHLRFSIEALTIDPELGYDLTLYPLWQGASGDFENDGPCSWNRPFVSVLPVLYSFDDITTPLADGSVPAVEVAKLILDLNDDHCEDEFIKGIQAHMDAHGDCAVYLPAPHSQLGPILNIYNDWLMSCPDAMIPPAAYDYLRSKHFAVGLDPHQYIRKSAASPASTATKEGPSDAG